MLGRHKENSAVKENTLDKQISGGNARKGGTDDLFLQGHHRDASEDDPVQKSKPRRGLIKTVCPTSALVVVQR